MNPHVYGVTDLIMSRESSINNASITTPIESIQPLNSPPSNLPPPIMPSNSPPSNRQSPPLMPLNSPPSSRKADHPSYPPIIPSNSPPPNRQSDRLQHQSLPPPTTPPSSISSSSTTIALKNKINVALLNVCSICNKCDDILDLIIDNNIHIFCLVETWLQNGQSSVIESFVPDTHTFHHVPRPVGRGGGVGIVISRNFENIKFYDRSCEQFECIELHATCLRRKLVFNVIYRPPNKNIGDFIPMFEKHILELEKSEKNVYYLGDFNIHMDDRDKVDTKRMNTLLETFSLKNYITSPTHRLGHTLDLVINNNVNMVQNISVDSVNLISDHMTIFFNIDIDLKQRVHRVISFRRPNQNFPENLLNVLSSSMTLNNIVCEHCDSPCISCYVKYFRQLTSEVFDDCCPYITKTIKVMDKSKNWYNSDVCNAKKNQRKAEKKYKNSNTIQNFDEYKRLRNVKCLIINRAKKNYIQKSITECNNDPSKIYNILNCFLGKSKDAGTLPTHDSKLDLSNQFRIFFIEKINKIVNGFSNTVSPHQWIPDMPIQSLGHFKPITPEEALIVICDMNKTFCHNDPFDVKKIDNDSLKSLSNYYADIANLSFHSGIFPDSEKYAYITPLLKKCSDPDNFSSYRPLYKTSFLSKFLEKCVLKQLNNHISKFECLPWFQSAYREFHSVETALCRVHNDLYKTKTQGGCSILILLDLSSAFDTIDRRMLLDDLKFWGIDDKALLWISSYLSDRKFRVNIDDTISDEDTMHFGVPQGTILGPVLFIIYTSSLQYVLQDLGVSYHLYADDTQIYFRLSNVHESKLKIQMISDAVDKWMNDRRLKMNANKTEIMVIGNSNNIRSIKNDLGHEVPFGNSTITLSEKFRNLGFIFDQTLNLSNHINITKQKAICGLINISHISTLIDQKHRLQLVHSLVLSHIDFCNSLYYGLSNTDLNPLQLILNSAARLIVNMPRFSRDRITPKCIDLHFLPIKARIEFKICLLTFKAIKHGKPSYLADLLKPYVPESNVQLRSSGRLNEPVLSNLSNSERCFEYYAPRLYNRLPENLKTLNSVECFKKNLKTHLFNEAYNMSDKSINPAYRV